MPLPFVCLCCVFARVCSLLFLKKRETCVHVVVVLRGVVRVVRVIVCCVCFVVALMCVFVCDDWFVSLRLVFCLYTIVVVVPLFCVCVLYLMCLCG